MKRAAAILLPVLLAVAGCSGRADEQRTAGAQNRDGAAPLTVPSRQLGQIGLTRVQAIEWTTEIHSTGTVDWNADRTTQVIAQVGGPISRIVVDLGQRVRAGTPLLYVASPDLSGAVAAYRKARNRLDLARRTLDRNRDLLAHGVIAQKDLDQSQADYNDAMTEAQNDLQALHILGVTAADVEQAEKQDLPLRAELAVRAPIDGVVVQKLVLPGQLIQAAATSCFVISDIASVWVQGHLHDNELADVRTGDPAEVRTLAAASPLHGSVTYVGAMLDPSTRTTPVRIATINPGGLLKKDQFVDVVIRTSSTRNVLVVPVSAVLYTEENQPFVYRRAGEGRFARALIQVGAQRGTQFQVLSGLNAGDTIVTEGGVFLQFAETAGR